VTESDFLNACADNPDDDLTRLAFADWLEEKGDAERADFIRLRVELWSQELQDKRERNGAEDLLKHHRERWTVALAVVANPKLDEQVTATPAIADDAIYVQTAEYLDAFAEKK
jgi:uncharacterized protein (TIGR02996 family)